MTKIVVNRCYGGFGLSLKAMLRYAELKGITLYPEKQYSYYIYWTDPSKTDSLYCRGIERDDKTLVKVVEELGQSASDEFAKLEVVEIPEGTNWEIDDYDGYESVEEVHRRW